MVWRDLKVRYKQTTLGVAWVILQPLITTLVFSGLFGALLQVPTGDIPYPLFVLSGLLPWQYFSGTLTKASNSLVDNTNLITKIYFPRLIIPLSAVFSNLVDFMVSSIILAILMVFYQKEITATVILLPFLLALTALTAYGFGLWYSALNVQYRDIKHLMPFIIQVWMYLTPVIYSANLIPEDFRWLLSLNPMTSVVMGFRWALFGNHTIANDFSPNLLVISAVISICIWMSGMVFFRRMERTFADII